MTKANLGISLIELLLVIAIIIILGASSIPLSSNFLARNNLRATTTMAVSFLHKAQINAMAGKENSPWGVNFTNTQITLFKGNSYAGRDPDFDQIYEPHSNLNITNTEVIMNKVTGNSTPTTINIANAIDSYSLDINAQGVVDVN